ncbi:TIR domain-containing protein [Dactylosporangium sp. NPDC049525]|uniref:TIR domain-containing protein n=1 Tax=Dactylosporangium sp. NPDC049525 TaxID=3154730 RepID=UPI003427297E
MSEVFLSYLDEDRDWTRTLAEELERHGLVTFLRERDPEPGDVLLQQTEAAIGRAGTAVLVLGAAALSDPQPYEEYAVLLREAATRGLRVIPVLCGDPGRVVPPFAADRLWADFRGLSAAERTAKAGDLAAIVRGEWRLAPEHLDQVRPAPPPAAPPPASFVVVYAGADAGYGGRLVSWLSEAHLPVWSIARLTWGSEYTREIRDRIRHSIALVVLMSPAAEESPDVTREILDGQRHDRIVFPVLIQGAPNFLLASTWYVDARDGALPGPAQLRTLQRVYRDHAAGRVAQLPPPRQPAVTAARTPTGLELARLRASLADGELEHADLLTTNLVLAAAGRLGYGWLPETAGADLPAQLLRDIDTAWAESTAGRQGFGRQRQLYRLQHEFGGDFAVLATAYGWRPRPDGRPTYGEQPATPKYGRFVRPDSPPPGFFPTLRNPQAEHYPGWHARWRKTVLAVHRQLRSWPIEG